MTELEQKEERWRFLNELRRRGIESPQSKRIAWEIMLIRVEQEREMERKAYQRDYKISQIIDF